MAGDSKGPIGHPDHVSERTIAITGGDAGYFDLIKDCVGSLRATSEGRALALGILGKQKVWISLETAAAGEARLSGIDFRSLQERARVQHEAVEKRRRDFAAEVFSPAALAH